MADVAQQLYEQTLVVRSQLGDEAAFGELLRLHGPRLLQFTRQMLASAPDQIDDVTQETWIAIYRGLPSLRDAAKFRPWAFRVARDRIYREHRRRKLPFEPLDEKHIGEIAETEADGLPLDPEELRRGLAVLTSGHREVLVLHFLEGLSYEDIAGVTSSALGTVRSRLHYGKLALRRALENQSHESTKSTPGQHPVGR